MSSIDRRVFLSGLGRTGAWLNTFEQTRRVVPLRLDAPAPGARMTFKLPPRSYTVAQIAVAS